MIQGDVYIQTKDQLTADEHMPDEPMGGMFTAGPAGFACVSTMFA